MNLLEISAATPASSVDAPLGRTLLSEDPPADAGATKDALFLALMDDAVRSRVDGVRQALTSIPPRCDRALVIGDRLPAALTADRDWQLLFLDCWQRAVRNPSLREPFVAHRRQRRTLVADLVAEVVPGPGSPELSSLDLATAALALSNDLAIERLANAERCLTSCSGPFCSG